MDEDRNTKAFFFVCVFTNGDGFVYIHAKAEVSLWGNFSQARYHLFIYLVIKLLFIKDRVSLVFLFIYLFFFLSSVLIGCGAIELFLAQLWVCGSLQTPQGDGSCNDF